MRLAYSARGALSELLKEADPQRCHEDPQQASDRDHEPPGNPVLPSKLFIIATHGGSALNAASF